MEIASRFNEVLFYGPDYPGYKKTDDIKSFVEGVDPDVLFIMLPGRDFERGSHFTRTLYKEIRATKILYDTDSQSHILLRCSFVNKNNFDYVLLGNNFKFVSDHEKLIKVPCKVLWQPFGVNPGFFADRRTGRPKDLTFLGNIRWRNYPDRVILVNTMRRIFGSKFFFSAANKIHHVKYMELLNKIKIFVSAGDIDKGFFMKYLEAMSSGCLLISQWSPCFEKLGFVSGEHLLLYNTFQEMVEWSEYYLENPKEREEIAFRGSRFVVDNHSWKHRVDDLIKILEGEKDEEKNTK